MQVNKLSWGAILNHSCTTSLSCHFCHACACVLAVMCEIDSNSSTEWWNPHNLIHTLAWMGQGNKLLSTDKSIFELHENLEMTLSSKRQNTFLRIIQRGIHCNQKSLTATFTYLCPFLQMPGQVELLFFVSLQDTYPSSQYQGPWWLVPRPTQTTEGAQFCLIDWNRIKSVTFHTNRLNRVYTVCFWLNLSWYGNQN